MAKVVGSEVWEPIGTTSTNSTAGSKHKTVVDFKHLWSLSQQESLRVVSNKDGKGIYRLDPDPEVRAQRIAGAYADLYFKSKQLSQGKLQFYWAALAAFVVKDIYYAYKYTREEVLKGGFVNAAGDTVAGAYEHALRTYAALAKGNIWLYMDIHTWMGFVLDWGLKEDGSVDAALINAAAPARNWSTYQEQSKAAVQWLPFGRDWLSSCQSFVQADPIKAQAQRETLDDRYVRVNLPREAPTPFRLPQSRHWAKFSGAHDVLSAYRSEMLRVCGDTAAVARLEKVRNFASTPQIMQAYGFYSEMAALDPSDPTKRSARRDKQQAELVAVAKHEQLHVLQPVIYDDAKLKETLDLNHRVGRRMGDSLVPYLQLVFSAQPASEDASKVVRFDPPEGLVDRVGGTSKSLSNPDDRMKFVAEIARNFNRLMDQERAGMETELTKIRSWYPG